MSKVKNRRINSPNQIKNILNEQINILRQDESLDKIDVARTIAYLSNIALSTYKTGELLGRVREVETLLAERFD